MDDIDRANDHAQRELENAIAAARGVMPADRQSAQVCVECGEPIPEARRKAISGCRLCAWCAETLESRLRRGL
jgi:phage/conjugal plasmid C-4 type zinc finger protein, TraR family